MNPRKALVSFVVLIFVLTIACHEANAQKSTPFPNIAAQNHEPKEAEKRIVRIPPGALTIEIDNHETPLRLANIDRRFETTTLIRFLTEYVVKSPSVTIVVKSNTKRYIEESAELDKFLEQLANLSKVTVVYLPSPTGADPNRDLKKYADEFFSESNNSVISK